MCVEGLKVDISKQSFFLVGRAVFGSTLKASITLKTTLKFLEKQSRTKLNTLKKPTTLKN